MGGAVFCSPVFAGEAEIWTNESGGATVRYSNGKVVTLSAEAVTNIQDVERELGISTGFTGQTGSSLVTAPPVVNTTSGAMESLIENGGYAETYGTEKAATLEEELYSYEASIGTAPTEVSLFGTVVAPIVLGASSFYVGYKIGEHIAGWLGIEGTNAEGLSGCQCGNIHLQPYEHGTVIKGKLTETGVTVNQELPSAPWIAYTHSRNAYNLAGPENVEFAWNFSTENGALCEMPSEFGIWPNRSVVVSLTSESIEKWCGKTGTFKASVALGAIVSGKMIKSDMRHGLAKVGWPSNKIKASEAGEHVTELPAPEKLTVAPSRPSIANVTGEKGSEIPHVSPTIVTTQIITELQTHGSPGITGKTETELEEEIPKPEPAEVGTHYKARLEELGFTKVELDTLTETATDPRIGPNEVSYTNPAEGTRVKVSTKVVVEQNPSTAPAPEAGGSIGPPTLPGIKVPNFAVLCKGFPFGVPCWLIKTVESWSTSAIAPVWEIGEFSIKGVKIPGASFHLSHLEPIMEYARPAMLIFATVGLVILFYKFATKGGGPPSGSGIDDPGEAKEIY